MKHTSEDHRDYNDLRNAHKKVQEVALYVNEKKREAENINKILEIQLNFTGKFEASVCRCLIFHSTNSAHRTWQNPTGDL